MSERAWGVVRLTLGVLQVFGATVGLTLLLQTGVNRLSLAAVLITGLLTTTSVVLFGGRKGLPASRRSRRER